ncbi:hypothetical protein [Citreimonas sp.]|uniref:hypothetical protein n=1 Tax=Citreimonas sp. TaxID=3036715 RepID=UPI0040595159
MIDKTAGEGRKAHLQRRAASTIAEYDLTEGAPLVRAASSAAIALCAVWGLVEHVDRSLNAR